MIELVEVQAAKPKSSCACKSECLEMNWNELISVTIVQRKANEYEKMNVHE